MAACHGKMLPQIKCMTHLSSALARRGAWGTRRAATALAWPRGWRERQVYAHLETDLYLYQLFCKSRGELEIKYTSLNSVLLVAHLFLGPV